MKRLLVGGTIALALILGGCEAKAPTPKAAAPASSIPYGANKAASGTFVHDGVTLYYETYGEGPPLLLVHGNGGSLGTLAAQIDFFKAHHRVIAMDSRDQGKSSDSTGPLTYEIMTDDLAALLDHLNTGPVDIVGWSDGGIEALLMGVRHPDKVKKLVAMAANLNPSTEAIYPETDKLVRDLLAGMTDEQKKTPEGKRALRVTSLMLAEPHIEPALLGKISAPTLVLGSDHDLIKLEHLAAIYNAIPNANLAIFPNSTHMVPYDNPALFNASAQRFLDTPFKKIDRIPDTMASLEKMQAGLAK